MNKAASRQQWILWIFGLFFVLFVIVLFTRWYQRLAGDGGVESLAVAARADLEMILRAEKAHKETYGFFTTDLMSLGVKPKFVFYKIGFVRPGGKQDISIRNLDPARKDLDYLRKHFPELKIDYSDRTHLDTFQFDELNKYCEDCTVDGDRFKAIAAANLDSDPELDVWTIDQDGTVEHVVDDLSK